MKEQTGDNLCQQLATIRDALCGPDSENANQCTLQTIDFADMRTAIETAITRLNSAEKLIMENGIVRDWLRGRINGIMRAAVLLQGGSGRKSEEYSFHDRPLPELISVLQLESERLRRLSCGKRNDSSLHASHKNQYETYKS